MKVSSCISFSNILDQCFWTYGPWRSFRVGHGVGTKIC